MRLSVAGLRAELSASRKRLSPFLALWAVSSLLLGQQPPPTSAATPISGRGEVTIPVAEYRALLEAVDGPPAAPGAQARVNGARFRIAVAGETADFEETFDVRVGAAGWTSLPVVRGPLDRASLAPSDRGAFFVARDVTRLAVLGPGAATASIGTRARIATDAGGRRLFAITMPLLAVQQGRVELPGVRLDVTVTGGEIIGRTEAKGATLLDVAARPGALLSVAYREQNLAEKGTAAALKASATVYSRSDVVGPNLVTDITAGSPRRRAASRAWPSRFRRDTRSSSCAAADCSPPRPRGARVRASRASPPSEPLEAHLRLTRPLEEGAPIELPSPRLVLDGPIDAYVELRPPQGTLVEMVTPGGFEPIEVEKMPPQLKPLAAEAEEVLHAPETDAAPKGAVYKLHRLDARSGAHGAGAGRPRTHRRRRERICPLAHRVRGRLLLEALSDRSPRPGKPLLGRGGDGPSDPARAARSGIGRDPPASWPPSRRARRDHDPVPGRAPERQRSRWSSNLPAPTSRSRLSRGRSPSPPGAEYRLAGSDYREGVAAVTAGLEAAGLAVGPDRARPERPGSSGPRDLGRRPHADRAEAAQPRSHGDRPCGAAGVARRNRSAST